MKRPERTGKHLFVLDTNVLLHDPTAVFRFQEHDVYLPMAVLEELDANQKGVSEEARNARQVSRFLDGLMHDVDKDAIDRGLELPGPGDTQGKTKTKQGRLFFQTRTLPINLPEALPGTRLRNTILGTVLALQKEHPDTTVTLVSKDINLRIKAAVLGLNAEDYYSDQVLDDVNLLFAGFRELPAGFWDEHGEAMESWKEGERTFYKVSGPEVENWYPNECLFLAGDGDLEAVVRSRQGQSAIVELAQDYRGPRHTVWGSTRATASRTSPSTCCWTRRLISSRCWAWPVPARPCSPWPPPSRRHWRRTATARSS